MGNRILLGALALLLVTVALVILLPQLSLMLSDPAPRVIVLANATAGPATVALTMTAPPRTQFVAPRPLAPGEEFSFEPELSEGRIRLQVVWGEQVRRFGLYEEIWTGQTLRLEIQPDGRVRQGFWYDDAWSAADDHLPSTFANLGAGYAYRPDTLLRFEERLNSPDWTLADPPRNPGGMLEAAHEKTGLTFVLVPEGNFRMGSPVEEDGRTEEAGPLRVARVPALLMCRTECAQRAWDRVGGEDGRRWTAEDLPVERVSWEAATAWCSRAGLRLPSEAEWEYACRAGSATRWCCGDSETGLGEYASYWENSDNETRPVGGRRPNAWGLHDMHGNTWEWCEDTWLASRADTPTDGSAWTGGDSTFRVVRGGGWSDPGRDCRSAHRDWVDKDVRNDDLGFRPAADLPSLGGPGGK